MKTFLLFIPALLIFVGCSRPCPRDIKIGEVYFSPATLALLPESNPPSRMEFQNMNGDVLVFNNQQKTWINKYQIPVETLCERGEFLDKTTQTRYFEAPALYAYFTTDDQQYTLQYDYGIINTGMYGSEKDTVLHEQMTVSGQKTGTPAYVGGVIYLSHLRGNEAKIPAFVTMGENARLLADTLIGGRTLYNVFTPSKLTETHLRVFYSAKNGIEAFTLSNGEVWLRK